MLKSAAFLDRDGVINKDKGYVYKISDFEWILGAKDAIKYLNQNNFYVFVVTNQSGISRGYYTESDVKILHNYINNELNISKAHIDDFFISPYHPDNSKKYANLSHLRKPNIGMLQLAEMKWLFDKSNSFLVGNKDSDIECAIRYGVKGYLFEDGNLLNFIKSSKNIC